MLKISAVYLIGKAEIPIHYTTWSQVEQALLVRQPLLLTKITNISGYLLQMLQITQLQHPLAQKYSRLRCLLHVKGFGDLFLFGLV